jgi:mannitol 2-dehydrogenase
MTSLSPHNLPNDTQTFSYDREAVNIGIVHFGVGNFYRAHQAVYVEGLLEKARRNGA